MKKFIINSIILLLFIAAIVLGIYVLNEYIIQNDTVAEVFHQGYDEVKTISKNEEQNVENQIELRELKWIIAKFIEKLPKEKRILFLRRYWFLQSVSEMARDYEITPKNMSVKLLRIRKELKEYLKEEGFEI